jgi:hypothetical protein
MRSLNRRHWPYQIDIETPGTSMLEHCKWLDTVFDKSQYRVYVIDAWTLRYAFKSQEDMLMIKMAKGTK